MEDYGLALKKLRQHFSLTQRELGERVGISNHAISKWEHGINQPDISALRAICAVYGITTEDFFRIAAGEEVEAVLQTAKNSPTENETAGAGTRSTQNDEVAFVKDTTPAKPVSASRKLVLSILCGILTVVAAVAITFGVAFGLTKNGLPNNPHSSATESGDFDSNSSDTATDTDDSSSDTSGDSSSDTSNTPPQRVIGHLDYYVDGRYFGADDIMEGEEVTPPHVEKTGYVFLGWYTAETGGEYFDFDTFDFENMDKSYYLYARFRPVKYYVVFMDGYGSGAYTTSVKYQESWTFPDAIFERAGYRLDGWETKNGIVYKCGADGANLAYEEGVTIRLTAVWTWTNPDAVHVKFINPDGEIAAAEQPQYVGVPFVLPAPTATKHGYKFGGYLYKNNTYQPGDTFVINADEVSDGEFVIGWWWNPIHFIIYYQMSYEGKRYTNSADYYYGGWDEFSYKETFNSYIPNFNRVIGWIVNGVQYAPGEKIPEALKVDGAVYYAEAVLDLSVSYTLHFASGHENATGKMSTIKGNSNTPTTLPECSFKLSGYAFAGWEYEGKTYLPNEPFSYVEGITEYTLTAVWKPAQHTLTFVSDKHTGQEFSISVTYLDKIKYTDILALCEEHGWDLTGLTLWGLKAKQTTYVAGPNGSYSCTHAVSEGENVTVKLLWEPAW